MVAVPTVLVALDWPAKSTRYQRVAPSRLPVFPIDGLLAPGFDPTWKSIDLAATVS
jgi:hypothetical protein